MQLAFLLSLALQYGMYGGEKRPRPYLLQRDPGPYLPQNDPMTQDPTSHRMTPKLKTSACFPYCSPASTSGEDQPGLLTLPLFIRMSWSFTTRLRLKSHTCTGEGGGQEVRMEGRVGERRANREGGDRVKEQRGEQKGRRAGGEEGEEKKGGQEGRGGERSRGGGRRGGQEGRAP